MNRVYILFVVYSAKLDVKMFYIVAKQAIGR